MASTELSSLELKDSIAHVFRARNILTAKDALFKTELELVELLDMPFEEVQSALAIISAKVCPPCHSVFDILSERAKKEAAFGHLPTGLGALDEYLWGGIPFGVLTEIVGHAGIGKTQFCLMMSVLATMPEDLGGLDGSVIYFDTEKKFRSGRLLQIAKYRFPEHFLSNRILEQLATRVLLVQPSTVAELMLRLQGLEESIRQHGVRLLVIDSVAALVQSEYGYDRIIQRQEILGKQASILKHLAEVHRMPIIVTNQVRFQGGPGGQATAFSSAGRKEITLTAEEASQEGLDLQLTAALGTKWAHAVNIRLVLESLSGNRYIKIAKSPMSATIAFHYEITAAGIEQIGDETFDASDGGRNMIQ
ncbi:hypothetical protein M758_5G002000 [Ceratodon purpureus]|nr:hypothetical protein M758_5G002000 [Ceratodon purpureus]